MKAARYARVSTASQADNTSLPNQLECTAAYVDAQGWSLAGTFVEAGESAENLDRPALTAVRQAGHRREFDVLVVYTLDRLTRDIDDLFLLRREFRATGVRVWAVHDGLDATTADVDDLLAVLFKGYFGHRELVAIRHRCAEGLERHVRSGKFPGGPAPLGYQRGGEGKLEVRAEDAQLVKSMYNWLLDGTSARSIAKRLTAMRFPTPRQRRAQKTRPGVDGVKRVPSRWCVATVRNILRSRVYIGEWQWGKRRRPRNRGKECVTIAVPALIDRDTWERAQEALTTNRSYTRSPRNRYLLRGLIFCQCGYSYGGRPPRRKDGRHSYRCLQRYGRHRCKSANVEGVKLEEAIWGDVLQFVRQPHLVAAELAQQQQFPF